MARRAGAAAGQSRFAAARPGPPARGLTPCRCSGVGLALCQRLLDEDGRIHLCIACRNAQRSEATRDSILATHPTAQVSTVEVDLGNLASVLRAARELRCRYWIAVRCPTGPPHPHTPRLHVTLLDPLVRHVSLTLVLFPVQVSAPGLRLPQRRDHVQPPCELQGALARSPLRVGSVAGLGGLVCGLQGAWGAGSIVMAKACPCVQS